MNTPREQLGEIITSLPEVQQKAFMDALFVRVQLHPAADDPHAIHMALVFASYDDINEALHFSEKAFRDPNKSYAR